MRNPNSVRSAGLGLAMVIVISTLAGQARAEMVAFSLQFSPGNGTLNRPNSTLTLDPVPFQVPLGFFNITVDHTLRSANQRVDLSGTTSSPSFVNVDAHVDFSTTDPSVTSIEVTGGELYFQNASYLLQFTGQAVNFDIDVLITDVRATITGTNKVDVLSDGSFSEALLLQLTIDQGTMTSTTTRDGSQLGQQTLDFTTDPRTLDELVVIDGTFSLVQQMVGSNLAELTATLGLSGQALSFAVDFTDSVQGLDSATASYNDTDLQASGTFARSVPEPTSLALLTGLGLAGLVRRRR